jgi:hypothetical protein
LAWGHARLDAEDVERYLQENRPAASAQTLRFYRESLNRMSLADLRLAVDAAGLECLDVVPWSDRTLVGQFTPDVLEGYEFYVFILQFDDRATGNDLNLFIRFS